jgi:LPXTG-motif cell wall-anchored protein
LEDGTNQQFRIPNGQQFNIDGQMTDAWGLKKGMKISATRIVEEPQTMVEEEKKVIGSIPPPPQVPPPNVPILIALALPAPPPASLPRLAKAELPKTGSSLPFIGFLGIMAFGSSLALRLIRIYAGHV